MKHSSRKDFHDIKVQEFSYLHILISAGYHIPEESSLKSDPLVPPMAGVVDVVELTFV
jgi:hypothetical protein